MRPKATTKAEAEEFQPNAKDSDSDPHSDSDSSSDFEPPPSRQPLRRVPTSSDANDAELTSDLHHEPAAAPRPNLLPELEVGDSWRTLPLAIQAVYDAEERKGYKFRRNQSKPGTLVPGIKRITLRCSSSGVAAHTHSSHVDPTNHRKGKTARTQCSAHINLNRVGASERFMISLIDDSHNHEPPIPVGGRAQRAPLPTEREAIKGLSKIPRMNRTLASDILRQQVPGSHLEPRQIGNVLSQAHQRATDDIRRLGGDFMAVLQQLHNLNNRGEGWYFDYLTDSNGTIEALFWASPDQVKLARRWSDVIGNDSSYNRNQYGMGLNIGVGIDEFGDSVNLW